MSKTTTTTGEHGLPRCALYARVSTSDQNCEMQVRELREYVIRRGWIVAGEHGGHRHLRLQGVPS